MWPRCWTRGVKTLDSSEFSDTDDQNSHIARDDRTSAKQR